MSKSLIQLRTQLSHDAMRPRIGVTLAESDVTILLLQDADVYKPNGELLCALRRNAFPPDMMDAAYPALHELRHYTTTNRGVYSGKERPAVVDETGKKSKSSATRDTDGKIVAVASASIGFFERQGGHNPACRALAFNANHVEQWNTILPMVRHADRAYQAAVFQRWKVQRDAAKEARPEYVIEATAFSTLTVNNNTCAASHVDAGDLAEGFGLISVLRRGQYGGCWLGFPRYGVAADLQHGDLLFFDPHEYHGNTPYRDAFEGYERISIVYYFRDKIRNCLSSSEELANARLTRGKL